MQFLYSVSRQFPFDETCEQIVRELAKRNWQVPGIDVEFHEYGSGAQKFRFVSNVQGHDFKLWFGRQQNRLPDSRWNDIAAVCKIVIPRKQLDIYHDESGPIFYLYVGNDYERDRTDFMNGLKVNSKLKGEPRTYLEYHGGCDCERIAGAAFSAVGSISAVIKNDAEELSRMTHVHFGQRQPLLIHNNDLGREYDPEGDEPRVLRTDDVMDEFRQYLQDVVLNMIMSHPIPAEQIDNFVSPEPIPFPNSVGSLFCFGEHCDAERIKQGRADPNKLKPADRYGMSASGYRLLAWGIPNDGTVPQIARDGFLWCGIGDVASNTAIESLHVPGHTRWSDRERFVIRLIPNRANDIYIADHAPYEKRRKEICEALEKEKRDRLTDAEVADCDRARARTIVPVSEYQGGYEKPVVLINRELDLDEVEVVSGPHDEIGRRRG